MAKLGVYIEVSKKGASSEELWHWLQRALLPMDNDKMRLLYACPDSTTVAEIEVRTKFQWEE